MFQSNSTFGIYYASLLVLYRNKKFLFGLFFSGLLIFINWAVWIYAVATDRIIDASFGYFIMPILSVFLGYIFFKEKLNKKGLKLFQSLKNIFSGDKGINHENQNNEIDILCGLMIEAANTDGKITQEELNKISNSLINVFKE